MARTNSFEGGSNGTTVTTGNSGGASGDAFDNAPTPGAGGVMTYSTAQAAHGSLSMTTSTGVGSALAYAGYTLATTSADTCRTYCRFVSLPSAQQNFVRYLSTGSQALRVNCTTSGLIEVRNAANNVVGTTTSAISAGSWFRLELQSTWSTTVGAVTLRLYLSPDSTTISDSLTLTSLVLTASANEIRYGVGSSMANAVQVWYDDLAIEGATWHGPATRTINPTGIAVAAALGSPTITQTFSLAPSGIAVPVGLGSAAVSQSFTVTPTGIAVPAGLGSPTVTQALAVTPDGVAVPLTLGSPTIVQALSVMPDGLAVGVNLGAPSVVQLLAVAPDGIAVPVGVGAATLSQTMAVAPDGIAVPVTAGTPAVAATMDVAPDGIAVPVALGDPTVSFDRLVYRPDTGTVIRLDSGVITRPDMGVTTRP